MVTNETLTGKFIKVRFICEFVQITACIFCLFIVRITFSEIYFRYLFLSLFRSTNNKFSFSLHSCLDKKNPWFPLIFLFRGTCLFNADLKTPENVDYRSIFFSACHLESFHGLDHFKNLEFPISYNFCILLFWWNSFEMWSKERIGEPISYHCSQGNTGQG